VLLTAALIVKNEEKFLGACLASIKGLVDEVVIVDTGSTDRSMEIALQAGARVEEAPWTGDFSAARNRALDLARGDWILYIDADETAQPGCFPEVRAQLAASTQIGYHVSLRPSPGHTPYLILRLFRNQPDIRFRGIIHENVWPSILERYSESDVGFSRLTLNHLGYEGDQSAKHARNLPLLHRGLRQDPLGIFSWCHLADIYYALGRRRFAERALLSAIAVARSRTKSAVGDDLPYLRLIPRLVERGAEPDDLMREALRRFPANAQLWWLNGRILIGQGKFEDAIPAFERVLAFGKAGDFDPYTAYDERIFTTMSYESLATCCFRLGRFEESRRYYELAAAADPARLEYRVKQALCARLLRAGSQAPPDPQ
jgi:glycosyltransferase involved in cell wall biosynthesis